MWTLFLFLTGCADDGTLTLFAAASTRNAVEEALQDFPEDVRTSYAASSVLARQIRAGARADVFLSASPQWANEVGGIQQTPLLGNGLVVVSTRKKVPRPSQLGDVPCVSIGDPEYVPSGIYAKRALEDLGHWERLKTRVIPAVDGPAAVAAVRSGACDVGIVYRTDVRDTDLNVGMPVKTAIIYPLVLRNEAGRALFVHLTQQKSVYVKHGFGVE